mmetsp:Transcript_1800/g.6050  ORF Transcript_1800/g.6050 Transcript_1800/m.6050 type:complete len:232 (+) Transcript_1800:52-747(+)
MATSFPPSQRAPVPPPQTRRLTLEQWTVRRLNEDAVTLLVLAWAHGCPGAKMALIDRADSIGLDLRAVNALGRQVRLRVAFEAPCTTKEAVTRAVMALREQASRPRVPWSSPVAYVVFATWVVLVAAWLHLHDVHVLEKRLARLVGLHKEDIPPSREFLGWITLAIVGTNVVEAIAVGVCVKRRFRFSNAAAFQWFLFTVVGGYPIAQRCVELKNAQVSAVTHAAHTAKKE